MKLMLYAVAVIAVVSIGDRVSGQTANGLSAEEGRAKIKASVSNMVAQTQAVAAERAAWRESNAVRFGTNWAVILFGTNFNAAAGKAAPALLDLTITINTNYLARKGQSLAAHLAAAKKGVEEYGKTPAEKERWLLAFDAAMTNATASDGVNVFYRSKPELKLPDMREENAVNERSRQKYLRSLTNR